MKVTDVRLRKIQTDGRMKALVSITPDGEFRDIAHPINSDMRQEIQDAVMKVYDETDEVIPDKNAKPSESEDNDNEEA